MDSGDANLQRNVAERLLSGGRIFLTGGAGCGKTYFVKELLPHLTPDLTHGRRVILMASTGLATTHLTRPLRRRATGPIGGPFTVHSAGCIPWSDSADDPKRLIEKGRRVLASAAVIIIDEISMLDRTTFQRLMLRLPSCVGILAVGDFFQLAPVTRDADEEPSFVFHDPAFQAFDLCELTVNYRQGEKDFVEHLGQLRSGCLDLPFYDTVTETWNPSFPVLFGTNKEVDSYNAVRVGEIDEPSYTSRAVVKVGTPQEAMKWFCGLKKPREELSLKCGMRVLCVQNHMADLADSEGQERIEIVNGDIGTVCGVSDHCEGGLVDWVDVEVARKRKIVVRFTPYSFQKLILGEEHDSVEYEVWQLPLIPAYGLTVHKAQGMSLDVVNVDGHRVNFAAGQVYVAVSRCRTKAGLRVANPDRFQAFTWPSVSAYYRRAERLVLS